MKVESGLPFSGLYNSVWEGEIDALEERAIEDLKEDWDGQGDLEDLDDSDIQEVLMDNSDYSKMDWLIAYAYTDLFADEIEEEFGFRVHMDFKELSSPREYNFETDRIFVEADLADILRLYQKVGEEAVAKVARTMFTSYDGFISFYDPDIYTWGHIEDWDYNQMRTIFAAAHEVMGREDVDRLEVLQEKISNIYDNNVDWDKVEKDLQYKLDVQNGGGEPDARKFPESRITDPRLYAAKFAELNHFVR